MLFKNRNYFTKIKFWVKLWEKCFYSIRRQINSLHPPRFHPRNEFLPPPILDHQTTVCIWNWSKNVWPCRIHYMLSGTYSDHDHISIKRLMCLVSLYYRIVCIWYGEYLVPWQRNPMSIWCKIGRIFFCNANQWNWFEYWKNFEFRIETINFWTTLSLEAQIT